MVLAARDLSEKDSSPSLSNAILMRLDPQLAGGKETIFCR